MLAMAGDPPPAKRSRENENENETSQRPIKRPRSVSTSIELLLPHTNALISYNERSFVVHKDVVCASSKFFKAACSLSWKEGQEGIVRLPTARPCVFEMYLDWIYFGEIASKVTDWSMGPLINLYMLGDMLDDKDLRNNVIVALQNGSYKARKITGTSHICHIWENTKESSMLRKWALDAILLRKRSSFEESAMKYPPDFVRQIAVKLMQQTPATRSADFLAKTREYQEVDDEA